jgi:hypothetical protein
MESGDSRHKAIKSRGGNERGEALIMVLVGAGLVGLIMLAVATSVEYAQKGAAGVEQQLAAANVTQGILTTMGNPTACFNTIGPITLGATNPLSTPAAIKDEGGNSVFNVGSTYESRRVKLDSLTLKNYSDVSAGSLEGSATLELVLSKVLSTPGPQTFTRTILVRTKKDAANKLIWCRGFSSGGGGGSDLWQEVGNGDIYYDAGKVGVGTNAPAAVFDVHSGVEGQAAPVEAIRIAGPNLPKTTNSAQSINWKFNGAGSAAIRAYRGWGWDTHFQILTNDSTETSDNPRVVMQICDSGYVGIGTVMPSKYTQPGVGKVLEILNDSGTNNSASHVFVSSLPTANTGSLIGTFSWGMPNSGGNPAKELVGYISQETGPTNTSASPTTVMKIATLGAGEPNATVKMTIAENGFVGIGTTAPTSKLNVIGDVTAANVSGPSDRRLKTDIQPLENALDKILSLNGVSYNWRRAEWSHRRQIGVIAQDVAKVYPEAVNKNEDGFLSVNYTSLVAPLIEAIKEFYRQWTERSAEQERELAELRSQVQSQQSQIEALKAAVCAQTPNASVCATRP